MSINAEEIYVPLGKRIKLARVAQGLSQAALAEKLTIPKTRQAINQWEQGQVKICIDDIIRIAELTGRPVAFFTEGLHHDDYRYE